MWKEKGIQPFRSLSQSKDTARMIKA